MASIDLSHVSTLLGFDISTFTVAGFILNIIIPFIVVWYAMYLLLCRIRVIRNNNINIIIGSFMSFLTLRLGTLAMWLGFAGILALKFDRWYDKALSIAVFVMLLSQITSIFSVHGALIVTCLGIALLCILKMSSLPMKIVAIVIMFAVYYFLSPYALLADTQVKLTI